MSKKLIGIVGSREYEPLSHVKDFIVQNLSTSEHEIVSGGARGVDRCAEETGKFLGFKPVVHRPQFPDGAAKFVVVRALFARNTLIAQDAMELHAFIRHGVRSNGTFDTVFKAAKMGKRIFVHYSNGEVREAFFPAPPTQRRVEQVVYFWEGEDAPVATEL